MVEERAQLLSKKLFCCSYTVLLLGRYPENNHIKQNNAICYTYRIGRFIRKLLFGIVY